MNIKISDQALWQALSWVLLALWVSVFLCMVGWRCPFPQVRALFEACYGQMFPPARCSSPVASLPISFNAIGVCLPSIALLSFLLVPGLTWWLERGES